MVNLAFVVARKKRIITLLISAISGAVVLAFCIIAFLGQIVGSFTVSIYNGKGVKIAIASKSTFADQTTHLRVGDIPAFDFYTNSFLATSEKLDNDSTDFLYGSYRDGTGEAKHMYFFKYTYFVKNVGEVDLKFDLSINLTENNKPKNVSYDLTDILRVRLYENKGEEHDYETYAKASLTSHLDEKGETSFDEQIAEDGSGYAKQFVNDTTLITKEVPFLAPNEAVRYTVVFWLEGEDPQAVGAYPEQCSLRFGANITAYEIADTLS